MTWQDAGNGQACCRPNPACKACENAGLQTDPYSRCWIDPSGQCGYGNAGLGCMPGVFPTFCGPCSDAPVGAIIAGGDACGG